jgi:hypothetical protein
MNYLDELFQKKQEYSIAANIQKFKSEYYFNRKTLHLFVEDDDDYEFYYAFAIRIYNDYQIYRYSQKGKSKLLETFEEISFDTYRAGRVLFFYDKDYDDLLEEKQSTAYNLFMTSVYSIENYLVNEEGFRIILTLGYKNIPHQLIENVINEVRPFYDIFCSRLKIVTSWILVYRASSASCDLDEIKFHDLFVQYKDNFSCIKKVQKVKYDNIILDETINAQTKKRYRIQGLKEILENRTKADPAVFSFSAFLSNYRMINSINDRKKYLRGKYEIWFLFKVLLSSFGARMTAFNEKAANYNAKGENKEKIPRITLKMLINEGNIFSVVPPKMTIPLDIDQFLKKNLATV